MVHLVHRWMHDRTDQLQSAFLNGIGYQAWENVWGQWNGITPRDAEALRRIHAIYAADGPYLASEGWEPFADTQHFGVFASRWPGKDGTLWTLVNRNGYAADGAQLAIDDLPGAHFYDLWNAKELMPERKAGKLWLSFPIAAHGFGAVLATSAALSPAQQALLRDGGAPDLETLSATWHSLPQQMLPIAPAPAPKGTTPPDMVAIPAADYLFAVHGIEVEGQNDDGADVQYPWEPSARRYHQHLLHIPAFLIDRTPVTNAAFKRFLDATGYYPRDPHNFLRDWKDGRYPEGWADKPVTWVSREDAEAYAHWAGKRLPHEWEWQYAAQGTDGRAYPWGQDWDTARVPATDGGRTMQPASDVAAHPGGASPFGVLDMVGNVWQWTDEHQDDHTRAAILRGGSGFQPQGSIWYFPQAYRNDQHGKLLLMAPGKDRAGTIGFRCVVDAS
jgi:formylglycine-generating enzyme required for sulfatase activity